MNRRKFFSGTAISAAGIMASGGLTGFLSKGNAGYAADGGPATAPYNLMQDVMKYRKADAHVHVDLYHGGPEQNIKWADRLGIQKMFISRPITGGPGLPKDFIESNNIVLKAIKKYPGRFVGQPTVNVEYQKESLEEIQRCIDLGMVGLKVYTQVKINDPLFYPIIEKMADLKMITHMHAMLQLGLGGYRMKYDTKIRPNTSIPEDFVDIAKRYPEAMFQYAHIGAGGDWEYTCKMLKNSPNVYVDTSGSSNDECMLDFAVREFGEDRVFFGSDNCYYQSVGKILASNLTETQKKNVFFDNFNNVLKKSGSNVD